MKITFFFMIGVLGGVVSPGAYGQESAYTKKHQEKLEHLQTNRSLDDKHTRQAQEEFRKGTAELSGHTEQQVRDVQDLKSIDSAVIAGKKQNTVAHQAYKDSVQSYGSNDSRSEKAKQTWKDGEEAMGPLLQSRQTLKEDIHHGDRLVHNEKTVLGLQKRTMDSQASYRVSDDRDIEKEEKLIAGEQKAKSLMVSVP